MEAGSFFFLLTFLPPVDVTLHETRIFSKHLAMFDVRESVHRDIIMKATNKMQPYRLIYYL
jgi:hypothetical protein